MSDESPPHGATAITRIAIGDIIRRSASRVPEKIAIIEDDRATSYREMDLAANRIAHFLLAQGLPAGAKIATLAANSTEYLQVIFGIHKAGMVWVPVNIVLGPDDIRYILEHAEVAFAIVDAAIAARPEIAAILDQLPLDLMMMESVRSNGVGAANKLCDMPEAEPELAVGERDLAMIIYTSGTTSRPKGAMHCHLAVQSAAFSNIGELSITRDDRVLVFLPLFHIAAHCLCMTFLAAGSSVVLQKTFDAGNALKAVNDHRVTFLVGLPMMYQAMLDHPDRRTTDLSCLRICNYAMAPMAKTLLEALIRDFCPNFLLTSGQTEAYPHTVIFRPEEQLRRFGNYWGQAAMVNDVAIMDEAGNLLDKGEIGEIVYRGPNMMMGYFKDPEATLEASAFGWHHTGDLGMYDRDGQLMFIDRKKDMIKSGGENVPSVKVEEVLLRHPAVASAAVIGVPHPRWQEAILACIELRPGASADEQAILLHCRAYLGDFEVPKAVAFLSSMPRTGTMKLRKIELRARFLDRFAMTEAGGTMR